MVVSAASEILGMTIVNAVGRRTFNEVFWDFSYAYATTLRPVNYFGVITGKLDTLFFPSSAPTPQTLCNY